MSHHRRMLSLLLLVALLLGVVQPAMAQEEAERSGLRFDAPMYAVDGPYSVGVRTYTIPPLAENDRELTATVWYPALTPDTEPAPFVYEQNFEPGQIPPFSVIGHARLDAEVDESDAPYPLVVYSHAHWSMGQELPYFVEHLASRGFVVISIDHEDNWSTDFGPMAYEAHLRRPQEVTRQIDFAETLSEVGGDLEGLIVTEKVGIGGWSMGGVTALAAAGARMDLENLRAWCEEDPSHTQSAAWACVDILDYENELAEFAGLSEVPTGLWPDWGDERIAAAIRLSGSMPHFSNEGLAPVDVPVMLLHGGHEEVTDPSMQIDQPYDGVSSEHRAEVVFNEAGHFVFFSSCDESPDVYHLSQAIGFPTFCADDVWDMDRAHDLINHFATAFLIAELKGDEDAAAALAPKAVNFPGIEYRAEGYGGLDAALEGEIDAYIEEMMAAIGLPGLALGVVKDGELAYAKGFGVADVETGEPVTSQTVFQLAEVTMAPTTLAMLQLADAGMIDLDAPITDYLPYFEMAGDGWQDITVRHLLLQTSGVPDSGDTAADWTTMTPELDDEAVEHLVRGLAETEMLFAPGEGFEWSDIGFHILGDVVAKVTGQPYELYMQENFFTPLGMTHSTFLRDEVDPALLASPHIQDESGAAMVTDAIPYSRQYASANNLHTNLEDMARFAMANLSRGELDGVTVVAAPNYDEMWAVQNETNLGEFQMGSLYPTALFADQGMGWSVAEILGHPVVHAYGGERGYQSDFMLAPEDDLAVIVMGNRAAGEDFYTLDAVADVMGMVLEATE